MGKIVNFNELNSGNELRKVALRIAEAGLEAIDSAKAVREALRLEGNRIKVDEENFEIEKESKVLVIGVGKCAIEAAKAAEEILADTVTSGVVLDVRENNICKFKKIDYFKGTHPFASEQNVKATQIIVETLAGLSKNDFVLFLISGGGSTLLCLPPEGHNYLDEKVILKELFIVGAPIHEINTIRKHMSLARGGYLAKHAYPARVASILFSDVPGNDLSIIASGPTVRDETTVAFANAILSKYGILKRCSLEHDRLIETPKEKKYFEHVYNFLAISNQRALEAMRKQAEKLGFKTIIKSEQISGEAREVGESIAEEITAAPFKSVLLYGGETTVTVKNRDGKGGRNQELALSALRWIKKGDNVLVLSLASDGKDNSEYAGALVDRVTHNKTEAMHLNISDYLEKNDSQNFFEKIGDVIITGDTGSNVSDLIIAIKS